MSQLGYRKRSALSSYLKSLRATTRNALVGVLIAATAVFTFGAVPTAAHAATVGTIADLQAALSPGTDETVTLSAHMGSAADPGGDTLTIARNVTLDLNGYQLFVANLTIAEGVTLTLVGGSTLRAGFMQINGTLLTDADLEMIGGASMAIAANGKLTSGATQRTVRGSSLTIANSGVITMAVASGVTVTGNAYNVRFLDNLVEADWVDLTIYAPTMAAAGIAFPAFPRTHATIASWNTESDGSGSAFTDATVLTPGFQWAYAQWAPAGITSIRVEYWGGRAGDGTGLVAIDTSLDGDEGDITDLVDFASDDPNDSTSGAGFNVYLTAYLAGPRVVTARLKALPEISGTVDVLITHADTIAEASLAMIPDTVEPGGTSVAYLSAFDFYGNSFGDNAALPCDWCMVTLSSSDPTDVIDRDTAEITFVTPGERTITARIQQGEGGWFEVTAPMFVGVAPVPPAPAPAPAPVPPAPEPAPPQTLAATGVETNLGLGVAMMLTLLGLGAMLVSRRRRRA